MSILVTGATGFIGSYLCRELLNRGFEVNALTHSGRTDNIKNLLSNGNFHLHTGDIQDTNMLSSLLTDNNVETVFHLAAKLPAATDTENPIPCFNVNAAGTLSMLQASAACGVKTFIYTSTMSVYSEPPDYLPVDEAHDTRPATIYGIAKLTGEWCCRLYEKDMKIIILRYGGVYGKHHGESDAVAVFTKQALRNQPLAIYGDGKQSSDFTCIDDAIEGTLQAWMNDEAGVYNIGSGQETGVHKLAELIRKITRSKSDIVLTGELTDRSFRFVLDISRACKSFGYVPRNIEEGLRRYLADIGHDA
jgi:nucleoside-diphosphate-sugar epimerase